MHVEFGAGAIERAFQDVLQLQSCLGIVIFAWQVNQAGIKPCVNIATHEQTCAGTFAQPQNAHGGIEQFVVANLKEFIARKGLKN